jgi:uncharacterized protein (DUF111 family)
MSSAASLVSDLAGSIACEPSAEPSSTLRWPRPTTTSTAIHAHWDLFSGAAGDMMLAACLDAAGDDRDDLLRYIIQCLNQGMPEIAKEFDIVCQQVWRGSGSIAAKHVKVHSIYDHAAAPVPEKKSSGRDARANDHSDGHDINGAHHHIHHHHEHNHGHEHSHHHAHHYPTSDEVSKLADRPAAVDTQASNHSHDGHAHSHSHSPTKASTPVRNLPQIRQMLLDASEIWIPQWVKTTAIDCFTELAKAEALVHAATNMDAVHFHEVGAVDSIVDTVGTLLALYCMGATSSFSSSPLPLGQGMVHTQHGILPVPAPAALQLMVGLPITSGPPGVTGELVTPTGAALLRTLLRQGSNNTSEIAHGRIPEGFILRAIGVGAGTKDFAQHPNVLRLLFGEIPNHSPNSVDSTACASTMSDMLQEGTS